MTGSPFKYDLLKLSNHICRDHTQKDDDGSVRDASSSKAEEPDDEPVDGNQGHAPVPIIRPPAL